MAINGKSDVITMDLSGTITKDPASGVSNNGNAWLRVELQSDKVFKNEARSKYPTVVFFGEAAKAYAGKFRQGQYVWFRNLEPSSDAYISKQDGRAIGKLTGTFDLYNSTAIIGQEVDAGLVAKEMDIESGLPLPEEAPEESVHEAPATTNPNSLLRRPAAGVPAKPPMKPAAKPATKPVQTSFGTRSQPPQRPAPRSAPTLAKPDTNGVQDHVAVAEEDEDIPF